MKRFVFCLFFLLIASGAIANDSDYRWSEYHTIKSILPSESGVEFLLAPDSSGNYPVSGSKQPARFKIDVHSNNYIIMARSLEQAFFGNRLIKVYYNYKLNDPVTPVKSIEVGPGAIR